MKAKSIMTIIGISILLASCKSGLLISETKVPFEKICGSDSKYKCRATGFGSNTPTYRIFEKERPDGIDKTEGWNLYHLGRAADLTAYNNTQPALELFQSDLILDTVKINYDLKNENITKILAELKSTLKNENISADLSTQISNDFQRQLNNELIIEAYIITYAIKQSLIDTLRKAADGFNNEERFKIAVENLKKYKMPLIKEVKVIVEVCKFNETRGIKNILKPILEAKLGVENPKIDFVLNGTISRQRTSVFQSSYTRTSIYSFGYFNDKWMM